MRRLLILFLLISFLPAAGRSPMSDHYAYRITLVQAAPGKLLDLIEFYKGEFKKQQSKGDYGTLWMRHSQGDHWDLLIIQPIQQRFLEAGSLPPETPHDLLAWQEDLFCHSTTAPEALRKTFGDNGFFHVEMFIALPGGFLDLGRERSMENVYARELHQPENVIFVRDAGAAWDIVTIGVFRDLKHYAASADVTPEAQQAAARAAGFESPAQIGPYLRRFIRTHHDTLAVAVK
jgi:hypothetical protein